jgi:hypothetical protein
MMMTTIRARRFGRLAALALALAAAAGAVAAAYAATAGQIVTVRVLRAKVLESPSYIAPQAGTVSRGEKLTFQQAQGLWYRVEGTVSGWIHRSNVVDQDVELSAAPGGGVGASSDEVELAGRGFTPQVEDEYRRDNPELDFAHVDAIEGTDIIQDHLASFVREGALGGER